MAQTAHEIPGPPDATAAGLRYVGFWIRFVAFLVDSVLVLIVAYPLLKLIYGRAYSVLSVPSMDALIDAAVNGQPAPVSAGTDYGSLLQWALAAIAAIAFWIARQATPGKMLFGARIVDARTFGKPSVGQLIGRYFAYYVSMLPFVIPLGFLWIGFDPRKQGWHDKLAGTVVVRPLTARRGHPVAGR